MANWRGRVAEAGAEAEEMLEKTRKTSSESSGCIDHNLKRIIVVL